MQVSDLIRYNHSVRGLYLDALAKLTWDEVTAYKGLSYDSIRNVFLHLTMVEDRWISYIIPERFNEWANLDVDTFYDLDSLKRYVSQVQARTEAYLPKLTYEELSRQILVPWGEKSGTKITIEKGLTHMILEDMIHYGELSATLWQMGLEAPYLGFWRYNL